VEAIRTSCAAHARSHYRAAADSDHDTPQITTAATTRRRSCGRRRARLLGLHLEGPNLRWPQGRTTEAIRPMTDTTRPR